MENYKNLNLVNLIEEIDGVIYVEEWKDVVSYEGLYAISSFGRVKSYAKQKGSVTKKETILKQKITNTGYCEIKLCKCNRLKCFRVHRLVGIHFIVNPFNKPQINHKKGVKTDNRFHQIEWSTSSENLFHAFKNGLQRQDGEHHATKKLNWDKVNEIRRLYMSGVPSPELAKKYEVHVGHIRNICYNIFWKDKNYVWDTTKRIKI